MSIKDSRQSKSVFNIKSNTERSDPKSNPYNLRYISIFSLSLSRIISVAAIDVDIVSISHSFCSIA